MQHFKGIIHCHSTYSYDGKESLSSIKKLARDKGLSFVCMTEHTDEMTPESAEQFVTECRELSDENFVFVPGFEVPYKDPKVFHVLMLGATEFVSQFAETEDDLREWSKKAQMVILPHPVRNNFVFDETLLELADGLEIWNQQYEGKLVPRTRSLKLIKELKLSHNLRATGGLDFHRVEHMGEPFTTIQAINLTEESIILALRNGDYNFGYEKCLINSFDEWIPTSHQKWQSTKSVLVITLGKKVNKLLHSLGLSLPKSLKQAIRSKV